MKPSLDGRGCQPKKPATLGAVLVGLFDQLDQAAGQIGDALLELVDGAEVVLQIRAAYLSEDDRAERFHEQRPRGRAAGRNRQKLAA